MKVWLSRETDGFYVLHYAKPEKWGDEIQDGVSRFEDKVITDCIDVDCIKQYLGISCHLRGKKILEGTMEFKWKEIKCKTKQEK